MGTAIENSFRERIFVPKIADGPKPAEIQMCIDGMQVVEKDSDADFLDSVGNFVRFPRRDPLDPKGSPILGLPYGRVFWELKQGNILMGEDGSTMFRRDRDDTGKNSLLSSFHAILSVEQGFLIPTKQVVPGMDRLVRVMLNTQTMARVRHGVKFSNVAFWRDRRTGEIKPPIQRLHPGDDVFNDPFEVTFDVEFNDALAERAFEFFRFVTAEDHSAENLARLFATPLLEPYKALSFLLYGRGGNGKGTLGTALARDAVTKPLTTSIDASLLLSTPQKLGLQKEQQLNQIAGKLWAIDYEADGVQLDQMTTLKRMSTGDPQYARKIGENSVEVEARCTLVLMTNNAVIMPDSQALRRRQVSVRFKDGRAEEEFIPMRTFIREYGIAPFMMASCIMWADHGDRVWTDVEIGDAATLSEFEMWLVDEIVANGYAISSEFGQRIGTTESRNSIAKLGLISKQKKINGKNKRVLAVGNEQRFRPFRTASEDAAREADSEAEKEAAKERDAKADVLRAFLATQGPASENRIAEALQISNEEVKLLLAPMILDAEVVSGRNGYALA